MKLKAALLNCTLKKSPEVSNTEALMEISIGHLNDLDVGVRNSVSRMVIERLDGHPIRPEGNTVPCKHGG